MFRQVISLESWVNIMYYVQDAHSFKPGVLTRCVKQTRCVVFRQVISLESWVNIMYYVQDAHSFKPGVLSKPGVLCFVR